MAEPACKTCKHFDAAMRGKGGECRDLTKRIFVRNSVPSAASPPWIQDEEIYTCLNHATRDESPNAEVRAPAT